MTNAAGMECQVCGFMGLDDGSDGFFYCQRCGSQAEGIRDTVVDNAEMLLTKENMGPLVQRRVIVKAEPPSQSQPLSQFWEALRTQEDDVEAGDGVGPTEPSDFGTGPRILSYEDYYSEIRIRYVMGVQIMIEMQVKALVEKFNVSPLIVGMVEPIWLRFVASTKLFADDWADEVINESESQIHGETDVVEPRAKHKNEPHNILGKRSVMIWYQSVSKIIPLSYSLVISFLVCHLAREPILSTDIVKWTLEGKLPYFAAFVEIEKQIGPPSNACPLSSSRMFRPIHAIPIQKLESLAASIAHSIGLELPPVNFYAIALRYLTQLSLPVGTILPHACRIYEWSMPPELWLSANEFRLPTRACVISILVVSIRILYNIHGFGKWEMALSLAVELSSSNEKKRGRRESRSIPYIEHDADQYEEKESKCSVDLNKAAKLCTPYNLGSTEPCSSHSDVSEYELGDRDRGKLPTSSPGFDSDTDDFASEPHNIPSEGQLPNLDATEILLSLESTYNELADTSEHSKDLHTYLQYCKDVVFAGVEMSFEDHEEEQIIEDLWDFYQKKEDEKTSNFHVAQFPGPSRSPHKRPRHDSKNTRKGSKKSRDDRSSASNLSHSCARGEDSQISMTSNSCSQPSNESSKKRAIRRMKSNMEENRFCYIPPRVKVKRFDYLHYTRKKDEGAYTYAAHADYYIILRSFARVAQLDVRSLHSAILSFERRLAWLEKNIDHCLKVKPMYENSCELCHGDEVTENITDDESVDFSKLYL